MKVAQIDSLTDQGCVRCSRRHKLDLAIEEKIFVSNDLEDLRAETLRTERRLRAEIEVLSPHTALFLHLCCKQQRGKIVQGDGRKRRPLSLSSPIRRPESTPEKTSTHDLIGQMASLKVWHFPRSPIR